MKLEIITGRSGSGKSSCLHLLEDLGYTCIDNLPITLLPQLIDTLEDKERIAIGIDIRNLPDKSSALETVLSELAEKDIIATITYLDASDDILIKRFSATRRKHPLSTDSISLNEALELEQKKLLPIQQLAKHRIDTSGLNIHQLKQAIKQKQGIIDEKLTLLFQSFGFKHGLPIDSDYVFDVRCLPNPYWEPNLRGKTGKEEEIIAFFSDKDDVKKMTADIIGFIEKWLPVYHQDNRTYMTISIGCTGGQHRSVFVSEAIYQHFLTEDNTHLLIRHRDLA